MGLFWSAEVVLVESLETGGVAVLVKVDLPQDVAWRQATSLTFNPEVRSASKQHQLTSFTHTCGYRAISDVLMRNTPHLSN